MEHVSVSSSQIASVAHDAASSTMQVLFRRGGLYEYSDVTRAEFNAVVAPDTEHNESVGTAFGVLIKGKKPFRKIEGSPWPNNQAAQAPQQAPSPAPSSASEPAALPAEVQTVSRKSNELTEQATAIKVVDPVTQQQASEILLAIASMRKEIADTFKPMKDAAFRAHRTICEQEKMLDNPLALAESAVKGQIGGYVHEQNRLAREAEELARKEAQREAEALASAATIDQAIEQAIDLYARGNSEAAEAVLAAPAPVPVAYVAPAPVAPQVAQVKGVATRFEWDFRIVAMDKIPREYLSVNESAIRSVVKATKGRVQIPGIEAFERPVVAASRRG